MAISKEEMVEAIKGMSVIDLAELVKTLEDELGVSAAAPTAVALAPTAAAGATEAAPAEEQTEFTVTLKEIGSKKIEVIKAIRSLTKLGLKEAKNLVESAPKAVNESVSKEQAEEAVKQLEAAGAKAEIS